VRKYTRRGIAYQHGFTLIELLVVIVVLGILAAISSANFSRMQANARTASCVSNQRNILEAAFIYAMDFDVPDGAMNIGLLQAAGYVPQDLCECPASPVPDFDDYTIAWKDGDPVDVNCDVEGMLHDWAP
jgi:prepilin-type N-terminal cleavage/methylation domain-containing protein